MASDLPDALEKLSVQAELSQNSAGNYLSKYFGKPDDGDDFFDTISSGNKSARVEETGPTVNLIRTPVKEEQHSSMHQKTPPTFAFKKGQEDEPKVFSFFSQSDSLNCSKDPDATEFFDQISQLASETHQPLEILNKSVDNPTASEVPPSNFTSYPGAVGKSAKIDLPISSGLPVTGVIRDMSPMPVLPSQPLASLAPQPLASQIPSSYAVPLAALQIPSLRPSNSSPSSPALPLCPPAHTLPQFHSTEETSSWNKTQEQASNWWLPGERFRRWQQAGCIVNSVQPTDRVAPSVSNSGELADPIKDMLRHFDGEAAASGRHTLTADLVSQDDRGIRELIKAKCWRAAANLCARLLTAYGQGYGKIGQPTKHTPHTFQLWLTRLAMLLKCRLTEMAYNEALPFGDLDSPDLYYEFYPELQKKGTIVPFALRLLVAQLPAYQNQVGQAQDRLCRLLSTVRRIIRDVDDFANADKFNAEERFVAIKLWSARETRIVLLLVNCALIKKDFKNAIQLLHKQLERPDASRNPGLYSMLGRVYLQLGDVQQAQKAFNRAADLRNVSLPSDPVSSFVDAGLVAIAQNAFVEAHSYYQQALALDTQNPMLVNNIAVCLLYTGCMPKSMQLLEENLGTKPDAMIRDETVLNVCTLYELESSLTMQRKLGMLRLASQWKNDNLNVASFKLQS